VITSSRALSVQPFAPRGRFILLAWLSPSGSDTLPRSIWGA